MEGLPKRKLKIYYSFVCLRAEVPWCLARLRGRSCQRGSDGLEGWLQWRRQPCLCCGAGLSQAAAGRGWAHPNARACCGTVQSLPSPASWTATLRTSMLGADRWRGRWPTGRASQLRVANVWSGRGVRPGSPSLCTTMMTYSAGNTYGRCSTSCISRHGVLAYSATQVPRRASRFGTRTPGTAT